MKKNKVFSLLATGIALSFAACNNSADNSATNDTTAIDSNSVTTVTSSNNYAARVDSVNMNVSAGNYLNPRTGKAYTKLNVDANTGKITDESGQPVRRYVDRRNWWVYDTDLWDTVGSAQWKNNQLWYRGDNGDWVEYDKRWTDDNMSMGDTSTSGNTKVDDNGNKVKDDNLKVKVADDGKKVKIKKTDDKH
jgi:hypothetical protein